MEEFKNIFKSLYFHFQVIEEFKNIFGPELEAVTGDPKRIEEVLVRVDNLVKPLEDVSKWMRVNPSHAGPVI